MTRPRPVPLIIDHTPVPAKRKAATTSITVCTIAPPVIRKRRNSSDMLTQTMNKIRMSRLRIIHSAQLIRKRAAVFDAEPVRRVFVVMVVVEAAENAAVCGPRAAVEDAAAVVRAATVCACAGS